MGRSLGYILSVTKTTPPEPQTKSTSKTPNGLRGGHREGQDISFEKPEKRDMGGSVICNIIDIKFSEISLISCGAY